MIQAFSSVANQILVLFFIMAAGYAAGKAGLLEQPAIKGISLLIMNVTLPAMIIHSMQFPFSMELLQDSLKMLMISVAAYVGIIAFSYGYFHIWKETGPRKDVLQFSLIFSNVAYMGYPVIQVVYGEIGVFYTALYNIPFNVVLLTLGMIIMSRSTGGSGRVDVVKALKNPGLAAVVIGFLLFSFSIRLPGALSQALETTGAATTPLAMIVIGVLLAGVSFSSVFGDARLYVLTATRLVFLPLVAFVLLKLAGVEGIMLGIPVMTIGMPVAVNTGAFASLYDSDSGLASRIVFLSTLCSMLTIPLWTMLL